MKKIGLLGGTSWPSTIPYYERLNSGINARLGGYNSARLVLHNVNYQPIKSRYLADNGWNEIPDLLLGELNELATYDPEYIIICNNTLHKAVDILDREGRLEVVPPIIHIVDSVAEAAQRDNHKRLLLLGTKFTMEDGFYANRLRDKFKLSVDVPSLEDRNRIQEAQTEIALGRITEQHSTDLAEVLSHYPDYDAVVLACTELPLAISEDSTDLPIIDPIKEQCETAIRLMLEP